jgi:hypothetical protein
MDVALNERTTAYESMHLFHYIWSNRFGSLINKQEIDVCRIANRSYEIYECYKIVCRFVSLFYYTVLMHLCACFGRRILHEKVFVPLR